MRRAIFLPLVAYTINVVSALPQAPSWQSWTSQGQPSAQVQALYTMTNDISGNRVVAISVDDNGNLSGPQYYSTGGIGGNYLNPATGAPHFPDALSAQDAVVVAGNVWSLINKCLVKETYADHLVPVVSLRSQRRLRHCLYVFHIFH